MNNNISAPRIQKFLASWGVGSRRTIEGWIDEGRILLNGKPAKPGDCLRESDDILVLGTDKTVLYRATLRGVYDERAGRWLERGFEYWMVNKPRGVLASTRDPHHNLMVTHLVPSAARLFPVGRLDKESEGLLLLTTDGELCHRLTHPRFGLPKRYEVTLDWPPGAATIEAISKGGVRLEDGPSLPTHICVLSPRHLELTMREGRKREIRRLFEHFGHRVVKLLRVAFGNVELGDLAPGQARKLTSEEVDSLRKISARSFESGARHYQSVEKSATDRPMRRPESRKPGQSWGRRSKRSSARKSIRKGSRS